MSYTPLSDEELQTIFYKGFNDRKGEGFKNEAAAGRRAIEAAATAPLLARIAELEAALAEASKDAQRWKTFLATRPASTHEVICDAIDAAMTPPEQPK